MCSLCSTTKCSWDRRHPHFNSQIIQTATNPRQQPTRSSNFTPLVHDYKQNRCPLTSGKQEHSVHWLNSLTASNKSGVHQDTTSSPAIDQPTNSPRLQSYSTQTPHTAVQLLLLCSFLADGCHLNAGPPTVPSLSTYVEAMAAQLQRIAVNVDSVASACVQGGHLCTHSSLQVCTACQAPVNAMPPPPNQPL